MKRLPVHSYVAAVIVAMCARCAFALGGDGRPGAYMVVDLATGGASFFTNVTFVAATNEFVKTEYRTTKMAFRLIKAGAYPVQNSTNTVATMGSDYYIGIYPVTVGQYTLMTNQSAAVAATGENMRPQTKVKWTGLRGTPSVTAFGAVSNVEPPHSIHTLNQASGLAFDLPTEAMWEVAARAVWADDADLGAKATWPWFFGSTNGELGQYAYYNSTSEPDGFGNVSGRRVVGTKKANPWSIFDVYGNVFEFCLDGTGAKLWSQTPNAESGDNRITRGGSAKSDSAKASSGHIAHALSYKTDELIGFRLARLASPQDGEATNGIPLPRRGSMLIFK